MYQTSAPITRYGYWGDVVTERTLPVSSAGSEGIARGSVQECVPQLELARRRGLIDELKHAELKAQPAEISRTLSGLVNGPENRET